MKTSIWRSASALALMATCALAQLNPPHPLPSELRGDLDPGETPQGAEDLRQSRDDAYGRALTSAQHDEILSWRTESPSWWMAPQRAALAHTRNDEIAALIRDTPAESLKSTFDAADVTFGLEIDAQSLDAIALDPGASNSVVVTVEVAKRPDLFPLVGPILDFAVDYWEAEQEDQSSPYFNEIVKHSIDCRPAVLQGELDCEGYSKAELLAVREELFETFDRELTELANEGGLALESELLVVSDAYMGANSALYDESAHRQFLAGVRSSTRAIEEAAANAIIAGVPDLLRAGLLELLVETHRETTISRAFLTATGAAAHLDAARSILGELEGGL